MTPQPRIEWLRDAADLDGVLAVDRLSFAVPWTRDMYEQELQHADVSFVAVARMAEAAVAGYCSYRLVAGELQISNVAVRPEFRRCGLGRALVAFALRHGEQAGAASAFLEVRRSNEAARRLYAEAGFVQVAERRGYYSHPDEDALVLTRAIRNPGADPVA